MYRMVNHFLEVWFQNMDSWIAFYVRQPDLEHKLILIQSTREMLIGFLASIEEMESEAMFMLRDEEEKVEE